MNEVNINKEAGAVVVVVTFMLILSLFYILDIAGQASVAQDLVEECLERADRAIDIADQCIAGEGEGGQ